MLRKILIWMLASAAIVTGLLAAGVFVLLRTPPGQDLILSFALPRLSKEIGFGIEIASARGSWPAQMEFKGVKVTDARGLWFEAERMTVLWRPELALSNRYVFDAISIQGGHLLREPETGNGGSPRKVRTVPRRYPFLQFAAINAKSFRLGEPLIGQALTIDLKGAMELGADGTVDAPLEIDASASELLSKGTARLAGERVHLSARTRGAAGRTYTFEKLKAQSERVALAGSLTYDVPTRDIAAKLAGTLDAAIAAKVDPHAFAQGPVEVTVSTHGPWKSLAIDLSARLPGFKLDDQGIAPSRLTANLLLSRAPREIKGPVSIEFDDVADAAKKSHANVLFVWDRKSAIRLDGLAAAYRGARVNGDVALDTAKDTLTAGFALDISELANLPLPLKARGSLQGKVAIVAGDTTSIDADLKSQWIELAGTSVRGLSLSSRGTPGGFTATLGAQAIETQDFGRATHLALTAEVARADAKTHVTINTLTAEVERKAVMLTAPATLAFGGGEIALTGTHLRWGDGTLSAAGSMGPEIAASLEATSVELPFAPYLASGTIVIDTHRAEAGTLAVTLTPASDETFNLRAEITGRWADERLALRGAIVGYGHDADLGRIEPVRLDIPLALVKHGDAFALSTAGAIEGRVAYAGEIDRFVPLFPLPEQTLTGTADVDVAISGTLAAPQFAGRAAIRDGTYEHTGVGVFLDRVNLSAEGTAFGGRELVLRASASDRRGGAGTPIEIDGLIGFQPQPKITATLKLDHARVLNTANVNADISGALKLEGPLSRAAVSGYVDINSAEFQIPKSLPPDIVAVKVVRISEGESAAKPPVEFARKAPVDFPLDVRVTARQQLFIRGRGIDSEWAASLHAMGTMTAPRVDGMMTLRRGRFDFSGRQFTLSSGLVQFIPSRTADPDLALEARNQAATGTTAIIAVSGRTSRPVIKLTSDPPLPQDDVMALVLFGRPADQLSALQALQVANAIGTLTGSSPLGGGGTGLLDRARATLGLDLLDVSVGGEGGSFVTVGKYLRRGVFVSASPGIGDKPGSISAEIELSKSVNVETKIGQDAQESVGINWKHDY